MFENALGAQRREHTSSIPSHSLHEREEATGELLLQTAKENGSYIEPLLLSSYGDKISQNTSESDVYIDKKNGIVYKAKDPFANSIEEINKVADEIRKYKSDKNSRRYSVFISDAERKGGRFSNDIRHFDENLYGGGTERFRDMAVQVEAEQKFSDESSNKIRNREEEGESRLGISSSENVDENGQMFIIDGFVRNAENDHLGEIINRDTDFVDETKGNILQNKISSSKNKNHFEIPEDVDKDVSLQIENDFNNKLEDILKDVDEQDKENVKEKIAHFASLISKNIPIKDVKIYDENGNVKTVTGLDSAIKSLNKIKEDGEREISAYRKEAKGVGVYTSSPEERRERMGRSIKRVAIARGKLAAIEREKTYREELSKKVGEEFGISKESKITFENCKKLFDSYNKEKDLKTVFDKIIDTVESLSCCELLSN